MMVIRRPARRKVGVGISEKGGYWISIEDAHTNLSRPEAVRLRDSLTRLLQTASELAEEIGRDRPARSERLLARLLRENEQR